SRRDRSIVGPKGLANAIRGTAEAQRRGGRAEKLGGVREPQQAAGDGSVPVAFRNVPSHIPQTAGRGSSLGIRNAPRNLSVTAVNKSRRWLLRASESGATSRFGAKPIRRGATGRPGWGRAVVVGADRSRTTRARQPPSSPDSPARG